MKLELKNIAKIAEASVEINGITVIAGENNTGKSTVGRTLFAIFNSFYNLQKQLESLRVKRIDYQLVSYLMSEVGISEDFPNTEEVARTLVTNMDFYKSLNIRDLEEAVIDLIIQNNDNWELTFEDEEYLNDTVSSIIDILNISDDSLINSLIERNLSTEFYGQITNIFSDKDGEIKLSIKNNEISLVVNSEGEVNINNSNILSLRTEAVYIDDPFVIDNMNLRFWRYTEKHANFLDHREHLKHKLLSGNTEANLIDEIIAKDKLSNIYQKLSAICEGEMISQKRSKLGESLTGYQSKGSDKLLNVRNLSTGLKTFVILKTLLTKGVIERNGTIILDEPEIHLHPEWQLAFAELIVLIQKEFGVHVLLNTHSPYFLNAIEVYAARNGISDKCKYYLATADKDVSVIRDVTEDIELIYFKLAKPLQTLENQGSTL